MLVRIGITRRLLTVAAVALTAYASSPPLAGAEGGSTIASSPKVVPAKSEDGNTANGLHVFDSVSNIQGWNSFWRVRVRAGDKLRIDWEAPPKSGTHINIFPVGTTDYSVGRARSLAYQGQNTEGKNELFFESQETGLLVLDVRAQAEHGATYAFVVHIRHRRHH
jgi:hypothetical protein